MKLFLYMYSRYLINLKYTLRVSENHARKMLFSILMQCLKYFIFIPNVSLLHYSELPDYHAVKM